MRINDTEYSRQDLLRRSSNPAALYGARRLTVHDGHADGLRVIEVWTADGLRLLLSEDRCLDIVEASYRGHNIGFLSKNGLTSNAYANASADAFSGYWSGGLLATCGLRNTGGSVTSEGEYFAMHGRIGITPAQNVGAQVDEDAGVIRITGNMRETALFGPCLELRRTVEIALSGARIAVRDRIFNHTAQNEPLFLLYHINFGFPFLDEGIKLQFPQGEVRGRTPEAAAAIGSHLEITSPVDGIGEQVFFHLPEEKEACVCLTNEKLGICTRVLFDAEKLPVLTQWKSMGSGDYALGIEPGTSFLRGRSIELADGYSCHVPAFESADFGVELLFEEWEANGSASDLDK